MTLWTRWPLLFVFAAALASFPAMAQTPAPAPAQTPATAQTSAQSDAQLLKPEQLDQLVAPIALYPDNLLAQVLIASTYPLEVVQAERWTNEKKDLKGDQLKAEVDKQRWDESVKSLVATPSVLTMMSTKLDWTQKLGDAVLAQQPDVMDAVQRLRTKAQANNKLASTKEQKVTVKQEQSKQIIVIEPAVPNTVYVPYYNPGVVYGGWPYPAYPPYYFPPPGYIAGGIIATGIAFGAGIAIGRWASGGGYWGGSVNWSGGGNTINVNRPGGGSGNWQHNPEHRQGVRYGNSNVQQKFGNNNLRGSSGARTDFRGRDQAGGGARPGGDRGPGQGANRPSAGGGDRPGAGGGNRPSAGGGDRPGAGGGSRPSGGGRDNAMNIQSGRAANMQSQRGHASAGGGGISRGGGGGGGGGRGGGGGGRRSDMMLKHDIALLGHLDNGLGFYRFAYNGSDKAYVGVIAQELQTVMPEAVMRGRDGYLRVDYDRLGIKFQTYNQWLASGSRIPSTIQISH